MNGSFASHVRLDERIAADVELYRLMHFPPAHRSPLHTAAKALYPAWIYRPSQSFLRRLAASRRS